MYEVRTRLCDLSYLRQPYERGDGTVGFRCAAEPVHMYVRKGGAVEDTVGRKCLCNGLTATIGLGQHRKDGYDEDPLVTLGEDLGGAQELIRRHPQGWSAAQAVAYLLERMPVAPPASSDRRTAPPAPRGLTWLRWRPRPHSRREGARSGSGRDRDDDLAARVAPCDVVDRRRGLLQGEGALDGRARSRRAR